MASEIIIFFPVLEPRLQFAMLGRTHGAMVKTGLLRERSGLPPLHPGACHSGPIDSTTLDRDVASDVLVALPAEKLTRAGDVFDVREIVVIDFRCVFDEWGPCYSQAGVSRKLSQEELEIIGIERYVGIKVPDDVKIQILYILIARVETMYFRGELPLQAYRHPYNLHPRMLSHIFINDFIRPIGRPITHDHPFFRTNRLSYHGFNGFFNIPFFIFCRSN